IRCFRLGHAQMWRAWTEASDRIEMPPEQRVAAVGFVSDALFAFIDRTTTALVEGYELERERWDRSAEARKAEVVAEILGRAPTDLDDASRALGYDLRSWHIGLLLWGDDRAGLVELQRAAVELSEAMTGSPRPLIIPSGGSTLWAWVASVDAP